MTNRGIALLLTIFITSLALALGVGTSILVLGRLGFSATTKESQVAFYAADTGIECALYWDIKGRAFSTSTTNVIDCAGNTKVVGGSAINSFDLSLPSGACARVVVQKLDLSTIVTSLGESTSCDAFSARTVQRGLEVTY